MVETVEYLGWERSRDVISTVIPDLGCWPRLYERLQRNGERARDGPTVAATLPRRGETPMTERELDALTDALLWGGPIELEANIMALFRRGRGLLDVADGLAVGFQRYLVDVVEHPHAFMNPMHAFDYLNVVNSWIRAYDHPQRARRHRFSRALPERHDPLQCDDPPRPEYANFPPLGVRKVAAGLGTERLLPALEDAILRAGCTPRGCAGGYLPGAHVRAEGVDRIDHRCRLPLPERSARAAQLRLVDRRMDPQSDEPPRRHRLRGWVKHQSRYIKRSLTHECFELYSKYFLK